MLADAWAMSLRHRPLVDSRSAALECGHCAQDWPCAPLRYIASLWHEHPDHPDPVHDDRCGPWCTERLDSKPGL